MQCPICAKEHEDSHRVKLGENIVDGGCVSCWEVQCRQQYEMLLDSHFQLVPIGENKFLKEAFACA